MRKNVKYGKIERGKFSLRFDMDERMTGYKYLPADECLAECIRLLRDIEGSFDRHNIKYELTE